MNVVVVGAGAGGLAAALTLSRAGHRVTVLERDTTEVPARFEDAFAWNRKGAPQFHHSHVFLPRLRNTLRDRYPDVLEGLADHGVPEASMAPLMGIDAGTPGAGDLVALPCRRTTYEWVLRKMVMADDSVQFRSGTVTGVAADTSRSGPAHVTGVLVEDGSRVAADLVVASTGRRGDVPGWLAELGINVGEESQESPATYATRFYRLRDGAEARPGGYRLGRYDGVGFGIFPADNDTHSVSLFVRPDDTARRRRVLDTERFDEACLGVPEAAPYVDPDAVEPITPVNPMAGLINRLRTFTDSSGLPLVAGFVALGDAYQVTNPTYGRGCSLAMMQAVHLADALSDHGGDEVAVVQAYEAAAALEIRPWYYLSVLADQVSAASDRGGDLTLGSNVMPRAGDPETQLAFARVFSLLDPPDQLYRNPELTRLLTQPPLQLSPA
ncbi:MAG TPA: FAD-dependent oxidoreductase [Acidimicrobiales bacterium]|nr:FAD-dependent oxidoreductase [Acidimicrobiales bacterium]